MTLIFDFMKGFIPVLITSYFYSTTFVLGIGFAVISGHIFPFWNQFRGGKGVATIFGVFCALDHTMCFLVFCFWSTIFILFRYSSLASIASLFMFIIGFQSKSDSFEGSVILFLMVGFVLAKHSSNFERLIKGKEMRFDFKGRH